MAAARAAGAGGGTVLSAHGTAKPDDATFFGVPIVPEKDTLLVLVPEEKADAVFDAVRALPCLAEKGSGVVFCAPVERFAALGGGGGATA
ncbi:MAG: P-II family nitrogen regulator [Kiritimatiellae bacterium]|nr:P-II family nitrogen regulator [Kiritimatiellia bacterium]